MTARPGPWPGERLREVAGPSTAPETSVRRPRAAGTDSPITRDALRAVGTPADLALIQCAVLASVLSCHVLTPVALISP